MLTVIKLVRLIHLLLAKGRRHLLKQTEKTCTIVVHRVEGVSHVTSASDYQSRRRCIGVPQCNVMFIYSSVLHSLMSSSLHFRHLLLPSLLLLPNKGVTLDIHVAMLRKDGILRLLFFPPPLLISYIPLQVVTAALL